MEQIWYNMLVCTVVILVTLLLTRLFRRRYSVTWRCSIWFLVLFRLLAPCDISLPFAYGAKGTFSYSMSAIPANVTSVLNSDGTYQTAGKKVFEEEEIRGRYVVDGDTNRISYIPDIQSMGSRQKIFLFLRENLWGILFTLWFAIALFLLGKQWFLYILLLRWIKKEKVREDSEEILGWIEDAAAKLRIRRRVTCFRCRPIQTPMAVGVFRCTILLPAVDMDATELKYVLHHELIHIKYYHTLIKMAAGFVQALYWFNPVIFYMRCLMEEDMEILCDRYVVKELSETERSHYNRILLQCASQERILRYASGFSGHTRALKRRMAENMWGNRKKRGVLCRLFVAAALVASLLGVSFQSGSKAAVSRDDADDYIEEYIGQNVKQDRKVFDREVDAFAVTSSNGQLLAYGYSAKEQTVLRARQCQNGWTTEVLSVGEQILKCCPPSSEPGSFVSYRLFAGQNGLFYLSAVLYREWEAVENELCCLDPQNGRLRPVRIPDAGMNIRGGGRNVQSFQVFADSSILVEDGADWYVYDPQSGERLCDVESDVLTSHFCAGPDEIYGIHMDQGGGVSIAVFDRYTGRERGRIRTDIRQEAISESGFATLACHGEDIYIVCRDGVYRMGADREAVQIINGGGPGIFLLANDRNWARALTAPGDGSYVIAYQEIAETYPAKDFLVRYTQAQ